MVYQGAWANSKAAIANFWKQHFWLSGHLPLASSPFGGVMVTRALVDVPCFLKPLFTLGM